MSLKTPSLHGSLHGGDMSRTTNCKSLVFGPAITMASETSSPSNGSYEPLDGAASSVDPVTSSAHHDDAVITGESTPVVVVMDNELANNAEAAPSAVGSSREGTTASARFNILSTMVGGGCLSLPMAFQTSGNLFGVFLLLVTAVITEFCFRILVKSARLLSPITRETQHPGQDSFESISRAAFGPRMDAFSKGLVTSMCFFGIVGYAVLLRDMLMPVTEYIFLSHHSTTILAPGPTWRNNVTMLSVVLAVTPLCTLRTLTSLQKFGAFSMCSVLMLGLCVVYRSLQCIFHLWTNHDDDGDDGPHSAAWAATLVSATEPRFHLGPGSWRDVLNVFPLYVSCYVCHYNILTVHNELRAPSLARVRWWLRSTNLSATTFYVVLGSFGAFYAPCTTTGRISGNVLLNFDIDDPLLLVGRMCLAITLTLAFPMLTIPARDILMRSILPESPGETGLASTRATQEDSLQEPLLGEPESNLQSTGASEAGASSPAGQASLTSRLLASMAVLWTGAGLASCVSSIDVVWDLLGSSLSILLSFIIPCASYIVIMGRHQKGERELHRRARSVVGTSGQPSIPNEDADTTQDASQTGIVRANSIEMGQPPSPLLPPQLDEAAAESSVALVDRLSVVMAWVLLLVFVPLMFLSTANAIHNTFWK
jgi:amino acid permease